MVPKRVASGAQNTAHNDKMQRGVASGAQNTAHADKMQQGCVRPNMPPKLQKIPHGRHLVPSFRSPGASWDNTRPPRACPDVSDRAVIYLCSCFSCLFSKLCVSFILFYVFPYFCAPAARSAGMVGQTENDKNVKMGVGEY